MFIIKDNIFTKNCLNKINNILENLSYKYFDYFSKNDYSYTDIDIMNKSDTNLLSNIKNEKNFKIIPDSKNFIILRINKDNSINLNEKLKDKLKKNISFFILNKFENIDENEVKNIINKKIICSYKKEIINQINEINEVEYLCSFDNQCYIEVYDNNDELNLGDCVYAVDNSVITINNIENKTIYIKGSFFLSRNVTTIFVYY